MLAGFLCAACVCVPLPGLTAGPPAVQNATFLPRVYEVTTVTGMPHLEEPLRYTTTREKRCLAHMVLTGVFPILAHPALRGCRLADERRHADTVHYRLICSGGHGTRGNAVWELGGYQLNGTLNVRLGGKNMTFYQRVTARPLGKCAPAG